MLKLKVSFLLILSPLYWLSLSLETFFSLSRCRSRTMAVVRGFSMVCLVVGSVVFSGGFGGQWQGGRFSGFGLIFAGLFWFWPILILFWGKELKIKMWYLINFFSWIVDYLSSFNLLKFFSLKFATNLKNMRGSETGSLSLWETSRATV